MLLVGQRVDRRAAAARRRRTPASMSCENVRMTTRVDPALEVARDVGDRLALPERDVGLQRDEMAAELADRDLERRARPQRRLLEQHRDVAAVRARRRSARAAPASGRPSAARPARGSARDRPASKSSTDRKSLRVWVAGVTGCVSFVTLVSLLSSGPVVRVDAHVLGAQVAGPHRRRRAAGAEVDADGRCRCPSDTRPPPAPLVVRLAVLEQHDRSDGHRGARQLERDAGAAGGAISRPQFGSPPWIAVLTSSEFAITLAALRASAADGGAGDVDRTSLVAPSPPRTMPSASSRQTARQPVDERAVARVVDGRRRWRRWRAASRSRWSSTRRRR